MTDTPGRQTPKPRSNQEAKDLINRFHSEYAKTTDESNFSYAFNNAMHCTDAKLETETTPAAVTFEMTVPLSYRNNPFDTTTHGGAVATFFDNCTSMPMFLVQRYWEGTTGVTRNLHTTYFRPVMGGETVIIETEVLQYGKTNATTRGVMRSKKDGKVLAHCVHEKVRTNRAKVIKL